MVKMGSLWCCSFRPCFFFFSFFFVSMPFLTPKISRVSTSLCAGRLSFASEKGKFISGGSIFLLPHICALSALLGFVCVCVGAWMCCFVDSKEITAMFYWLLHCSAGAFSCNAYLTNKQLICPGNDSNRWMAGTGSEPASS